jgi:hypothetical protein
VNSRRSSEIIYGTSYLISASVAIITKLLTLALSR